MPKKSRFVIDGKDGGSSNISSSTVSNTDLVPLKLSTSQSSGGVTLGPPGEIKKGRFSIVESGNSNKSLSASEISTKSLSACNVSSSSVRFSESPSRETEDPSPASSSVLNQQSLTGVSLPEKKVRINTGQSPEIIGVEGPKLPRKFTVLSDLPPAIVSGDKKSRFELGTSVLTDSGNFSLMEQRIRPHLVPLGGRRLIFLLITILKWKV